MHVVLVEPEIPPNTGNVARLCAATQIPLHLVGKLGFRMTNRYLKRAGLDYWPHVELHRYDSLEDFLKEKDNARLFFFSKRASQSYVQACFREGDFLIFGSETKGLPDRVFERYRDQIWRIPILNTHIRSLNLSNAVAVVVYEALRQTGKLCL